MGGRLIGINKGGCVIQNDTALYKNAPIYAYGNFYMLNFTVKMTVKEMGDWHPSFEGRNSGETYPGYAIHIDHVNMDGKQTRCIIRNCIFYSEAFPAAGVGMNENQEIVFDSCTFVRNVQEGNEYFFAPNFTGAFVAHSSNYNVNNQYLKLKDNSFISNGDYAASFLMRLEGERGAEIYAFHNFFSSKINETECVEYDRGNSILNENSRLNTAECLNAK